jgi:hypothetical protein
MADVRLDFYDLDAEELPELCMKCGAPSTVRTMKNFSWTPYWARFMPWMIRMAFMKRRRVPVPLCEQHKNHWMFGYVIGLGGLAVLLGLFFGGMALLANDENGAGGVIGYLCLAGAGLFLVVWLIALIVLAFIQISVVEITDDTIVLKHVSPDFAQAYREQTRGGFEPDVERVAREQFGRPGGRGPREDDPRGRRRDDDYPPDDKYRR